MCFAHRNAVPRKMIVGDIESYTVDLKEMQLMI